MNRTDPTLRSLFGLDNDQYVTGLSADSRQIKPGMVFAALPSATAQGIDGRDFIPAAIKNGAIAVLSLPDVSEEAGVAVISDAQPRRAYAQLAARLYPDQPPTVVAMTGTNGKSSTVEFLRQIWAHAGLNAACFGTLGVRSQAGYRPMTHTTPDAVALHQTLSELAGQGVTHAAMEASSHGLKQYRLDGVAISAAGFTNLTQDHFDYHPDVEDYFGAKSRLFTELTPKDASVVINVDDEFGQQLSEICAARGQKVVQVGRKGRDIGLKSIRPHGGGSYLTVEMDGAAHEVDLPLIGDFQALNAVSALGLAIQTGVSLSTALEALSTLRGVAGRLELAGVTPEGAPIFVDFAHSEDGLETVLNSILPHMTGDIVLVFGCGGDRDPDKRAKMGRVAERLATHVIVTDDNPRGEAAASIRKAVLAGCPSAREIGDRRAAIAAGIAQLKSGDCLVVAGKGHESGQIIKDKIIPFSDIEVVQDILGQDIFGKEIVRDNLKEAQ